jgi:hypothetical protein
MLAVWLVWKDGNARVDRDRSQDKIEDGEDLRQG